MTHEPDTDGRAEVLACPFAWADEVSWHKPAHRAVMASVRLGAWLSAALDDRTICDAMKSDIREWFSAGEPMELLCQALAHSRTDPLHAQAKAAGYDGVAEWVAAKDHRLAMQDQHTTQLEDMAIIQFELIAAKDAEIARYAELRTALATAGPIHAGPIDGELGRKYPKARKVVVEYEQGDGAYALHFALATIRQALAGDA